MPDDVDFLFGPTPHQDAIDFIKSKPIVARDVFDGLLPDLKARAFTIAGLEGNANIQQAIRDRIADLPAGHDWNAIKKDVANDLTPLMVDPNEDDPEIRDGQIKAAHRKAELLLRTHGFQAYQVSAHEVMARQADVLPFWQYLTMEDERVRPEHAALDKLILPANDPFWDTHTGPWDYGCRCQKVAISQDERDEQHTKDQKVSPDQRLVCEPAAVNRLNMGQLIRDGRAYDIRPPTQKEGGSGYSFNPNTLRLPLDKLKLRYDAPVWAAFESWSRKTPLGDNQPTVWEWLGGRNGPPPLPHARPTTLAELVARHSPNGVLDPLAAEKVIESMSKVRTITLAHKLGDLQAENTVPQGDAWCQCAVAHAEDFIKFIPEHILQTLPKLHIRIHLDLPGKNGAYDPGDHSLNLSASALAGDEQLMRETVFHELMHWVHLEDGQPYKDKILALFNQRTAHEATVQLPGYDSSCHGKPDNFWDAYMGRQYKDDKGNHAPAYDGCEIPTRTIELLCNPTEFAQRWNNPSHRAILEEVFSLFFSQP